MKQKYISKLEHIRECREKDINPMSSVDRNGNPLDWNSVNAMIDDFVNHALHMKEQGKPHYVRIYNKADPEYLDALEELHPRLKELRSKW